MGDESNTRIELLRSLAIKRDNGPQVRRNWRSVAFVALAGGLLAAAVVTVGRGGRIPAAPTPVSSKVAAPASDSAVQGSQNPGLVASGYVVARRQATVAAEITGRIIDLPIEEGQHVAKGQVLAVLDRTVVAADQAAAVAQIRAAEAAADALRAELKDARLIANRSAELGGRGFATNADLTRNRARVETLEAQLERARADIMVARAARERVNQQAERFWIRAPFAGIVIDKNAQTGEIISPVSAGGGFTRTGICTLVDMSSLEIEVDVSEQFIARVHEGQDVVAVMDAYTSDKLPAYVIAIIPAVDRGRSTVRIRIGLRKLDSRLLPNMAVKVRLIDSDLR
ncbi:efflux RND transporter periplasmic adaptor subunit [Sphingomonas sp.]|uniref:efflux RND transporter periplasmic adaptor subunit n=1 Tax=Sphingomonas sp. TaxID=28214 RepID=UPI003D6CF238